MRNAILIVLAFLALTLAGALIYRSQPEAGVLTVEDAWARAPQGPGMPVEVFFTVVNGTDIDDSLYAAHSSLAQMRDLMTVVKAGAPSTYALAGPVRIPRKSKVLFKPNGLLLGLNMLQEPVLEGDTIRFNLQFQNAGDIPVEAKVHGPFAYGP